MPNLYQVVKMFGGGLGKNKHIPIFGSKIPKYQQKANINFTQQNIGHTWTMKKKNEFAKIDKREIHSGDFIAILRLDGIHQLIHYGSGSKIGHSTMALWEGDELYVIESQDAHYWPQKNIQKTKWETWLQWAHNADYNVVILPLKEEKRKQFNVDKAWETFYSLEGLRYGFSNFIFGWIDTPDQNFPPVIDLLYIT